MYVQLFALLIVAVALLAWYKRRSNGRKTEQETSPIIHVTPTPDHLPAIPSECGPACLVIMLAYFGKTVSLAWACAEVGLSVRGGKTGCSALDLKRAAQHFGLECQGYRIEPNVLRTMETPCILHLRNNLLVVYEGLSGDTAYINDPTAGRISMPFEELVSICSGTVLVFHPTQEFSQLQEEAPGLFESYIR